MKWSRRCTHCSRRGAARQSGMRRASCIIRTLHDDEILRSSRAFHQPPGPCPGPGAVLEIISSGGFSKPADTGRPQCGRARRTRIADQAAYGLCRIRRFAPEADHAGPAVHRFGEGMACPGFAHVPDGRRKHPGGRIVERHDRTVGQRRGNNPGGRRGGQPGSLCRHHEPRSGAARNEELPLRQRDRLAQCTALLHRVRSGNAVARDHRRISAILSDVQGARVPAQQHHTVQPQPAARARPICGWT